MARVTTVEQLIRELSDLPGWCNVAIEFQDAEETYEREPKPELEGGTVYL